MRSESAGEICFIDTRESYGRSISVTGNTFNRGQASVHFTKSASESVFVVNYCELTTPLRRLKEIASLSALWLIISNQEA
jgi:hypothetical protein